jgi:hypothetical protein
MINTSQRPLAWRFMPTILEYKRQRQKDLEFEVILGYTVSPFLKNGLVM